MSIFRAYDIRGIYPDQLNEQLAEKIGSAFATWLKKDNPKVAVGMDARSSGPMVKEALIRGLTSAGAQVIDIGLVPTPFVYFSSAYYGLDGGVMITASHNPPNYNGFKLCRERGISLSYETGIGEIESLVKSGELKTGDGSVEKRDILKDYIEFALSKVKVKRPTNVVVDAGNGSAGPSAVKLLKKAGCRITEMYTKPDGSFPNHHPDPSKPENLKDLCEKVSEKKADLGLAFDGDGDRLGVVDEMGRPVQASNVFALFIKDLLSRQPGAEIIYDVVTSKMIEDVIKESGGIPIISKTGHSYIQDTMVEKGCALAGEASGHYYFADNFSYDDALFAALALVGLLKERISEEVRDLPEYISSKEHRPHCDDDKKARVVETIKSNLGGLEGAKVIDIDGIRAEFEDSWFIVRVSNTAPQLVVRWEARDQAEFDRIGNLLREQLEPFGIKLD